MDKTAIVIPCYNRVASLKNLLQTIQSANIGRRIDLVFSIDYSGESDVEQFANSVEWKYGNKRVICHETNIGLRSNILFCGDLLISDYDSIILLEDDLLVAPDFIEYALQAAEFYKDNEKIGGISLFSYHTCEEGFFEFYPFKDEYDTFFIQWPSSWGQLWTRSQWLDFKNWLSLDYDFSQVNIPESVKNWKNSWKKFYAAYLVETDRFFVYPYFSYSAESCSPGIHFASNYTYPLFNNTLQISTNQKFNFRLFSRDSRFCYDCFFQWFPQLIKIGDEIITVSFDLYSTKRSGNIDTKYVLTSRNCDNSIKQYGLKYIPLELNIVKGEEGNVFSVIKTEDLDKCNFSIEKKRELRMLLSVKDMVKLVFSKIRHKMKHLIN